MKTFKQYLNESLDKPFDYKSTGQYKNSSGETEHHYSFKDDNGNHTYVYIAHSKDRKGNPQASVDFTDENGDIQATGKGSIRHFSTIKKIMKDHAEKHPHLKMYTFTGEVERDPLYTRLAKQAGGHSDDINAYSSRHYIPINRDKNGD